MSFCSDIKKELISLRLPGCCRPSLAYGLMLFGRSFSLKKIVLQTLNGDVARFYSQLIAGIFCVQTETICGGKKLPTYKAYVTSQTDCLKIMAQLDYGMGDTIIDSKIFQNECCEISFIRGAFLSCGNINNPEKEYRAEFSVKSEKLAIELSDFLLKHGISAKISSRNSSTIIYMRDSSSIEDLLTLLGLSNRSLELMDTKIIKGVKNKINRTGNCDNANIARTVEASIKQRTAIEHLISIDHLESLPKELLYAARLRLDNPEDSLKELCRISNIPITVSGLNHRFKKIMDISESIKERNK